MVGLEKIVVFISNIAKVTEGLDVVNIQPWTCILVACAAQPAVIVISLAGLVLLPSPVGAIVWLCATFPVVETVAGKVLRLPIGRTLIVAEEPLSPRHAPCWDAKWLSALSALCLKVSIFPVGMILAAHVLRLPLIAAFEAAKETFAAILYFISCALNRLAASFTEHRHGTTIPSWGIRAAHVFRCPFAVAGGIAKVMIVNHRLGTSQLGTTGSTWHSDTLLEAPGSVTGSVAEKPLLPWLVARLDNFLAAMSTVDYFRLSLCWHISFLRKQNPRHLLRVRLVDGQARHATNAWGSAHDPDCKGTEKRAKTVNINSIAQMFQNVKHGMAF